MGVDNYRFLLYLIVEMLNTQVRNPLGLIILPGFGDRGKAVVEHIRSLRGDSDNALDYIIDTEFRSFSDGARKVVIKESIRGKDLFILGDVTNYDCTYNIHGHQNRMSPYDHYQDYRNVLSAAVPSGAARHNIIMPFLIDGRQHRRNMRESLNCAHALQELRRYNRVENIITVDAHDPEIQNAVPDMGFHNMYPSYTLLKHYLKDEKESGKLFEPHDRMILAPDEGAAQRAKKYARFIGASMGMFYKERDINTSEIIEHVYVGGSLEGKRVLIVDDMIASGKSIIDVAHQAKQRGAEDISAMTAFGLFTNGFEEFKEAHKKGMLDRVYCTNLSHIPTDKVQEHSQWLTVVDGTKMIAKVVDALNKSESVTDLYSAPQQKLLPMANGSYSEITNGG